MANSFLACFKYIENEYVKTAWGLGKDGKVEPACKHCFQYLISVCQLLVYPMIGQLLLLTSTLTSIASRFANAESNKHEECVKPSYTAHFDISHFDTRNCFSGSAKGGGKFGAGGGGWCTVRTELFKNMLTGLPLLSFRRFSLARSLAFSPLPCFVCLFAVTESLHRLRGRF